MVKTDKTIIAILDKIEGMERQNESFSTTKWELFNDKIRAFQQQKEAFQQQKEAFQQQKNCLYCLYCL